MSAQLQSNLTREQAFDLLKQYNQEEFHIIHGETLERLMRYFAQIHDPENVDFWGQVGMLHDMDWEVCDGDKDHTLCTERLLSGRGVSEQLIHSIQTRTTPILTPICQSRSLKWSVCCLLPTKRRV